MIVNGPYEAPFAGDPSGVTPNPPLTFGTFDVGSAVTVSESGAASSVVITSPTGPASALTVDAANRRATLIMGYPGAFNELVFTNTSPSEEARALTGTDVRGCPGQRTAIPIRISLASQGNETSINFIVQFDQTKLGDPIVELGSGAAGFNLAVDNTNAGSGQIGVTLTSPTNTPFVAGTPELITIRFVVAATAPPGGTQITFGGPTQTVTTIQNTVAPTVPGSSTVNIVSSADCETSADVIISGRVTSPDGVGLRNASVTITDQAGNRRTVTTSSLGYYTFEDVKSGETYVIGASSRRFRFSSRVLQVSDSLSEVYFVGME